MGLEIIASVLSGALSLAIGGLVSTKFIRELLQHVLRKPQTATGASYQERLATLTESLTRSSAEVDAVLSEIARVARDREMAVTQLEQELQSLEAKEKQLQKRIQDLQSVPLPVADHFAALTAAGDKRSARRDYVLFGAGVVVSTAIAIVLHLVGLA